MEKVISSVGEDEKINIIRSETYWHYTSTNKLLDLQMGNSAFVFGYSDQDIIDSMQSNLVRFVKNGEGETSYEIKKVVKKLLELSGMSALSWTVSGTDAVETAVAISDRYWMEKDYSKRKILSFLPCYHGASWLTRALRGDVNHENCVYVQAPRWPDVYQRHDAEFSCLEEIRRKFQTENIGTLIVESIPWIEGIYPFSDYFWKELKNLCDQFGILIILDDVAGCFGKLGKPFSHKTIGIEVDIIAVGKSISGGYSPIGATLINQKLYRVIGSSDWNHTYTYNPNMMGISAINAVLDKLYQNIFDTLVIENKMQSLLTDLGIPFRSQGICFDLIADMKYFYPKLKLAGFSFNAYNMNSIPLIVPLIADDEYFNFLRQGLAKVYEI